MEPEIFWETVSATVFCAPVHVPDVEYVESQSDIIATHRLSNNTGAFVRARIVLYVHT